MTCLWVLTGIFEWKKKNQNRKHHLWFGGHGVPGDSGAQSLFSRGNSLRRILSPMFVRIWSFRSKTLFQSKLHRNGDLSAELLPRPKFSDRSEIDHIWMWGLVLQKDSPEEMSLKRGWGGDQVQGQGSPPMKGRKCIGWNCWHLAIFDLQKWQSLVLKLKVGWPELGDSPENASPSELHCEWVWHWLETTGRGIKWRVYIHIFFGLFSLEHLSTVWNWSHCVLNKVCLEVASFFP